MRVGSGCAAARTGRRTGARAAGGRAWPQLPAERDAQRGAAVQRHRRVAAHDHVAEQPARALGRRLPHLRARALRPPGPAAGCGARSRARALTSTAALAAAALAAAAAAAAAAATASWSRPRLRRRTSLGSDDAAACSA